MTKKENPSIGTDTSQSSNSTSSSWFRSMTGFGVIRGSTLVSNLEVSVRSVNGRFLESRFHLPREFNSLEYDMRKILNEYFLRGSIDVFVARKNRGDKSNLKLFFHENMAKSWMEVAHQFQELGLFKKDLDINTLIQLPEVVGFEEESRNIEQDIEILKDLFRQACESCQKERLREGEALKIEMLKILERLESACGQMYELREQVNHLLKEKMETRLKNRWAEIELDPQRLQQEVALLWDKSDITEELSRLKEHLIHYRTLLQSSDAQGKKLDFYTQELLREVNTIGSKSPLASLTHLVVMAKTEIEKLREQVQNIE